MRTRVYVDGFNLYYGALKGTSFKWLDPVRLSRILLPPECVIDKLRYFTARVSGIPDPAALARQHTYLGALGTLPEVEMHFGSFLFPVEGRGSVRFAGKKAISSFVFDRDARFHWWYTRFDSALEIDLVRDGRRIAATGRAVLEHMDFRGQAIADK